MNGKLGLPEDKPEPEESKEPKLVKGLLEDQQGPEESELSVKLVP